MQTLIQKLTERRNLAADLASKLSSVSDEEFCQDIKELTSYKIGLENCALSVKHQVIPEAIKNNKKTTIITIDLSTVATPWVRSSEKHINLMRKLIGKDLADLFRADGVNFEPISAAEYKLTWE